MSYLIKISYLLEVVDLTPLRSNLFSFLAARFTPQSLQDAAILACFQEFWAANGAAAFTTEIAGEIGHITVAAQIENPQNSAVLLVFAAKLGKWTRPGAHIEKDAVQTAISIASRALGRAAGTPDSEIFALVEHQIPPYWNTSAHRHFEIVFRFVEAQSADLPRGARWFSLDELPTEILMPELRR